MNIPVYNNNIPLYLTFIQVQVTRYLNLDQAKTPLSNYAYAAYEFH